MHMAKEKLSLKALPFTPSLIMPIPRLICGWIKEYNDNLCWMREDSGWVFGIKELEKGKIRRGLVKNVHDGDTIDISFGIYGIRRIRLVGVNTPELGTQGGEEAKEFVNKTCLSEVIELDVDDKKQYNPYCRILAVIYMNSTNLNKELLRKEYAAKIHTLKAYLRENC